MVEHCTVVPESMLQGAGQIPKGFCNLCDAFSLPQGHLQAGRLYPSIPHR